GVVPTSPATSRSPLAIRVTMSEPADFDDDLAPEAPFPTPPRSREPLDMVARVKGEAMRLDQYVHFHFPDFSRSEIQKSIEAGNVRVNDKPAKASYKVRNNDRLHIELPEPTHDLPVPEDIPLDILYQDG